MKGKFLFHKIIALVLITMFISLFTCGIAEANYSYKYNDYISFLFPDENYFDRKNFKDFLNSFNNFTKGLNARSDYNTTKKQMINKILDLRDNYSESSVVSNISTRLLNTILADNSNSTTNLIQTILKQISSLFSSTITTISADETVKINSDTATQLAGNDYSVELSANIYYAGGLDNNGNPKSDKWVVLIHGFRRNGQAITDAVGEMYINQGYNILAPDLRGSGNTGGKTGMGYLESLDVFDWLTYINERFPNNSNKILVHGVSLGGATTLYLSGLTVNNRSIKDLNVIGLVDDCGYTSMTGIIKDLLGTVGDSELVSTILGLFNKDGLDNLLTDDQIKNFVINYVDVGLTQDNYDEKQDALNSLKNCEVPILIIHGTEDTTVPYKNSETVYNEAMKISTIPYVQRFSAEGEPHAFIVVGNQYNVYEGHVQNFITKAESISAGNTTDKESDYVEEKEEKGSTLEKILKTLILFKDMLF